MAASESAPKEENKPTIEVFTDDELKQLQEANKRYKAGELKKLLKRVKALDAMDAEYDEKAAALRSSLGKQLGSFGVNDVSKGKVSTDDDTDE